MPYLKEERKELKKSILDFIHQVQYMADNPHSSKVDRVAFNKEQAIAVSSYIAIVEEEITGKGITLATAASPTNLKELQYYFKDILEQLELSEPMSVSKPSLFNQAKQANPKSDANESTPLLK